MNKLFESDLSFQFIMGLYRIKIAAQRGGRVGPASLREHYPGIFTDEFDELM
jgi:hypothetical protein